MRTLHAVLRQAFLAMPLVYRRLRLSWRTTLVCFIGLGLGSGSVAAVLAVSDVVFLRSLPYARATELAIIRGGEFERTGARGQLVNTAAWLRECPAVANAAFFLGSEVSLVRTGDARRVKLAQVSPDFFRTMRSAAFSGRALGAGDSISSGPSTTVVSHALWRRLGSPRTLAGESVLVEGRPVTIVGIMPEAFEFPGTAELWVLSPDDPEHPMLRGALRYEFVARLHPGLAPAAATAIVAGCRPQSSDSDPGSDAVAAIPLRQYLFGRLNGVVPWLQVAALLVLVIAAFNVAILQAAEVDRQAPANAVSVALGADDTVLRGHSVARLLLLAAGGAALGLLCGLALLRAFQPLVPPMLAGILAPTTLGWRPIAGVIGVCAFATLAAAATARIFAPAAALLVAGLRNASGAALRRRHDRVSRTLLGVEITLATTLLVSFCLLASSFHRLLSRDPGIVPTHVGVARLSLVGPQYDNAQQRLAALRALLAALDVTPGVRAAAATSDLPFAEGLDMRFAVRLAGAAVSFEDPTLPQAGWRQVTPGYFSAMGIRLLEGRDFAEGDAAEDRHVIVLNKRLADALGGGSSLVGRSIELEENTYQVVGVVNDVRHHGLALDAGPEAYVCLNSAWVPRTLTLVASAPGLADGALATALRESVARGTTNVAFSVATMASVMAKAQQTRAFAVSLVEVFAGIAAILAAIGVFAVAQQSVVRRRGEFAVRVALGSSGAGICRTVLRPALWYGSVGVSAGVILGFALHRALASAMPSMNVAPADAVVIVAVALMYAAILIASLPPALAASHTNAAELLRS